METGWILSGGIGFLLAVRFGYLIDDLQISIFKKISRLFHQSANKQEEISIEISLITRICASLRSGSSLDGTLEEIATSNQFPINIRRRLSLILEAKPDSDFLSEFLHNALQSGSPLLSPLTKLQKLLSVKKRMHMRASALSGQARAQAFVLTWLPWLLALFMAILDPELIANAMRTPISWLLWSIALLLSGAGKIWITEMIQGCLNPKSQVDSCLEEDLPDVLLRLISHLSLGIDPSGYITALNTNRYNPATAMWLSGNKSSNPPAIIELKSIIEFGEKSGAPIRDDLVNLLSDLQANQEAKWEERLQRLPVTLLAPLFACFFPACLFILMSLIWPLWETFN